MIGTVGLLAALSLASAARGVVVADAGRQPRLAVAADGAVAVVYGLPVKDADAARIVCAVRPAGSTAFTAAVDVATLPKAALGMRRGPQVVWSRSTAVVLAVSHATGTLAAWRSTDGGATWAGPVTVNDAPKSAIEGMQAVAADADGVLLAAWLDGRAKGTAIWTARSADGGATWSANVRAYASPDGHVCECCSPAMASAGRGEFAVMFRNWLKGNRDMYLATTGDGGKTFGTAFKLGRASWPIDACPMAGGWLAPDGGGGYVTVWRREGDLFACRPGERESAFASGADQPWIARGTGGPVRVWAANGSIRAARAGGADLTIGTGAWPVVASGPAGSPVVTAWQRPGDAGGIEVLDLP